MTKVVDIDAELARIKHERQRREKTGRTQSGLPPTAEEALALAFDAQHAASLRYVAKWGSWLSFDGARWQHDDTLHDTPRLRSGAHDLPQGGA